MLSKLSRLVPRRAWLIMMLSVVGAVAVVLSRPEDPPVTLPEKAWVVDVTEVHREMLRPTLELYGRLESPRDAGITAAVDGEVLRVEVRDGDFVEAGTTLVTMDERALRFELLQREAELNDIQAQVRLERLRIIRNRDALEKEREVLALVSGDADRARSLRSEGLLSQADVDAVLENFKRQELSVGSRELAIEESGIRVQQLAAQQARAEALRDQAALQLERTRVTAPFDGVVSALTVSTGDRAQAGAVLMRLHDPESLQIRAQVPSRHASGIRDALATGVAMPARVELQEAYYAASLERVSGQIREGSGTIETFLSLESVPTGIAGLGATVRVVLSLPPVGGAIALPQEALYGRNLVYRVDGDRMRSVRVERIGERLLEDGRSEVIVRSPDLQADDRVVVTRLSTATDGLLVRRPDQSGRRPAPLVDSGAVRLVGGEAD